MKTAISLPDDLFAEAESLVRRKKVSRSRLFSDALREYVRRHDPESGGGESRESRSCSARFALRRAERLPERQRGRHRP